MVLSKGLEMLEEPLNDLLPMTDSLQIEEDRDRILNVIK